MIYYNIVFIKALNNSVKKLYFILQKKLSIPFERKYNGFMYGKEIVMERVVSILTFAFVSFAVFFNFNLLLTGQESSSLIPYSEFVVIFVHCVISVGTFINIFKPNLRIQFIYFQIESILTILSSYEILGMFLFYSSISFLYLKYYPSTKLKKIAIICFVIHFICLLFLIAFSFYHFVFFLFASLFMMAIFLWFFEALKSKYSFYSPEILSVNSNINNLKPGSEIVLSTFGLTERQVNLVYDYITENLTFKELSERYCVSLSTVKLEFMECYKIFGVSKLEDFRILLMQFIVKK